MPISDGVSTPWLNSAKGITAVIIKEQKMLRIEANQRMCLKVSSTSSYVGRAPNRCARFNFKILKRNTINNKKLKTCKHRLDVEFIKTLRKFQSKDKAGCQCCVLVPIFCLDLFEFFEFGLQLD